MAKRRNRRGLAMFCRGDGCGCRGSRWNARNERVLRNRASCVLRRRASGFGRLGIEGWGGS